MYAPLTIIPLNVQYSFHCSEEAIPKNKQIKQPS